MIYVLDFLQVIADITSIGLPLAIVGFVIGVIVDLNRRQFHWAKRVLFVLLFFLLLQILHLGIIYQVLKHF